jgi:hypothetical protein
MSPKKPPVLTGPIVVVFGSERLASIWARRNAFNPRRVILATQGGDRLLGLTPAVSITVVRFPEHIWEPVTHPCGVRVREVEDALKRHKKEGGEIIELVEA